MFRPGPAVYRCGLVFRDIYNVVGGIGLWKGTFIMKTIRFSRLVLLGALALGFVLAWCGLVPASVSPVDADTVFGAATCKCGERPDCPTNGFFCPDGSDSEGSCNEEGKYLKCKDKKDKNYSCTLNTDTPCGTDGDCELCTGGSYDKCPE